VCLHCYSTVQDVYPGLKDVVISGACHYGEEYEDTAIRELNEELGLPEGCVHKTDLKQRTKFRWADKTCDVWGCAFAVTLPASAELARQKEEVATADFLAMNKVRLRSDDQCSMHRSCAVQINKMKIHNSFEALARVQVWSQAASAPSQFTPVGLHVLALLDLL
jgi:isopentenyldiphosphate isomerase